MAWSAFGAIVASVVLAVGLRRPALHLEIVAQGRAPGSNYQFAHERCTEPKIHELRMNEGLDRIATTQADEWCLMLELAAWARSQFEPGLPEPYPPAAGVDILAEIRAGRTGGFCAQYAFLFADALKAVGHFDVRPIELESLDHDFHFTTEVWSNRWQSWAVIDPYFATWYADADGRPLSAWEMNQRVTSGREDAIIPRSIACLPDPLPATASTRLYYSVAVGQRSDHAGRRCPPTIEDRLATYIHMANPASHASWRAELHYANESSRREDFEVPCNQAFITCAPAGDGSGAFECSFETKGTVAHFRRFEVTEDGETWSDAGPSHRWQSRRPGDALSVVAMNVAGIASAPATVVLRR